MEACGGNQVFIRAVLSKPEHLKQTGDEAGHAGRKIASPRVCPTNMGAERASMPARVEFVGKMVVLVFPWYTGNILGSQWYQRRATAFSTHHARGKLVAFFGVGAGHLIDKPPEAGNVLVQLPDYKVGPVTSEIS